LIDPEVTVAAVLEPVAAACAYGLAAADAEHPAKLAAAIALTVVFVFESVSVLEVVKAVVGFVAPRIAAVVVI
jgi:hypothetical protein